MSRAETGAQLLAAAAALGMAQGVGALTIQAIAGAAGVSKALVLYHFTDKATLLRALHGELASASAARLRAAAARPDPLEAWRALVHDEAAAGALALLAAMGREAGIDAGTVAEAQETREAAATVLATAILGGLDLRPRVAPVLLGRVVVRHVDGVAFRRRDVPDAADLDAELDAFALAFLALGE